MADKLAAERAQCFTTNWIGCSLHVNQEQEPQRLKGYRHKVTKRTTSLLENLYVTIFFCLLKCHNRLTNQTDVDWLYVYPRGMEKIITYVKKRFNNTPMIITENGYGEVTKADSTIEDYLQDVN
ncbi:hypothetical protein Goari_004939 [Gossypium aridum]|uniref:Thioglucosidase n=1 Tax=Gossypium aridum TaxID=34290 RepID=A0A7J8Y507_GOSAI|nr:hypothetical protein [Gossypium aridum]